MASLIVHLVGAAQMDQAVWTLYACILLRRNSFLKIKAVNLAAAIVVSVAGTEKPAFSSTEQHIFIRIFKDEPLNVCVPLKSPREKCMSLEKWGTNNVFFFLQIFVRLGEVRSFAEQNIYISFCRQTRSL